MIITSQGMGVGHPWFSCSLGLHALCILLYWVQFENKRGKVNKIIKIVCRAADCMGLLSPNPALNGGAAKITIHSHNPLTLVSQISLRLCTSVAKIITYAHFCLKNYNILALLSKEEEKIRIHNPGTGEGRGAPFNEFFTIFFKGWLS